MARALKLRDIAGSLQRKGFRERSGGAHRVLWYVDHDLAGRVQTMVSRSSRGEVGPSLIADMARQCRLNRAEFLALVDCSLSKADYRRKLLEGGYLTTQFTEFPGQSW